MSAKSSLAGDKSGGAALEFALVAPPFIAMIVGVVQFGWAMNSASLVHDALVTQGRSLIFNTTMTADDLQNAVRAQVQGLTDSNVAVTLSRTTMNGVAVAIATATYTTSVGAPPLFTYPVNFTSTVTVPVRQS